jgi:predicted O-linked N-acetylglucosamine transferase (SPINDLY family)
MRPAPLAACVGAWHEVCVLEDVKLVAKIRDERIDILVDLTMHVPVGRPLLVLATWPDGLAVRPAGARAVARPVRVSARVRRAV